MYIVSKQLSSKVLTSRHLATRAHSAVHDAEDARTVAYSWLWTLSPALVLTLDRLPARALLPPPSLGYWRWRPLLRSEARCNREEKLTWNFSDTTNKPLSLYKVLTTHKPQKNRFLRAYYKCVYVYCGDRCILYFKWFDQCLGQLFLATEPNYFNFGN